MPAPKIPQTEERLVTLHPGRYWKVDTRGLDSSSRVTICEPTNALLLEFQGYHDKEVEAWHALAHGHVLLVWESSFKKKGV
jgi:hypothetical protein